MCIKETRYTSTILSIQSMSFARTTTKLRQSMDGRLQNYQTHIGYFSLAKLWISLTIISLMARYQRVLQKTQSLWNTNTGWKSGRHISQNGKIYLLLLITCSKTESKISSLLCSWWPCRRHAISTTSTKITRRSSLEFSTTRRRSRQSWGITRFRGAMDCLSRCIFSQQVSLRLD